MTLSCLSNSLLKNANRLLLNFKNVSLSHPNLNMSATSMHRFTQSPKLKNCTQSMQWILAGGVVVSAKIAFDSRIAKCQARIEGPSPILEKNQDSKCATELKFV